jgi:integrase
MTAPVLSIPFVPVLPGAAGALVLHGRELRDDARLEDTSRFADDRWVLTPAILQRHQPGAVLDFTRIPAAHRAVSRELFYGLLSGPLPPGLPRVTISTVRRAFTAVAYFLTWAARRAAGPGRPTSLGGLTLADLEDFHRHLAAAFRTRGMRAHYRASARLLWHYRATLSDPLPLDPGGLDGWGEPNRSARGENRTARIDEAVIGPLLAWALRFTDDFAPDILAAAAEALPLHGARLAEPGRALRPGALEELLAGYERDRRPLPGYGGKPNATFLARKLGCYPSTLRRSALLAAAAARTGVDAGTYLDARPAFVLDGRPWLEQIAYSTRGPDSLGTLTRMLQTACYILIAYLTGMRDSEIKHLTRGCTSAERDSTGTAYRWKITGLAFKGETTTRGVAATWVAGHPAARAVTVLEQLQPPGQSLLFARLPYREGTRPSSSAAVLTTAATQQALADFTAWVNAYCARTGRAAIIPAAGGPLTTRQFRRTLAWHIARRPGGVIAGALQYRHHAIQMFESYAGTSASGFRAEAEAEQAIARGEHLLAMTDQHHHDLTGPAAGQAASRLATFAGFAGRSPPTPAGSPA